MTKQGITSYGAMLLGASGGTAVVIEYPSRRVEAVFEDGDMESAHTHARLLNAWLTARPTPDMRYPRRWVPDADQQVEHLLQIVERDWRYEAIAS